MRSAGQGSGGAAVASDNLRFLYTDYVKRQIVEIGLVIGGHYLLQRLIKQGEYCTIYQGLDQLFQRSVAVKAVPADQMSIYRAAVRMTSQISYPDIFGLYDLLATPAQL